MDGQEPQQWCQVAVLVMKYQHLTCDQIGSLLSASGSLSRPFDLSDVPLAQLQRSTVEFAYTWSANASLSLAVVFSLAFHVFLEDDTVLLSRSPSALFFFSRLSLNASPLGQRHILLFKDSSSRS